MTVSVFYDDRRERACIWRLVIGRRSRELRGDRWHGRQLRKFFQGRRTLDSVDSSGPKLDREPTCQGFVAQNECDDESGQGYVQRLDVGHVQRQSEPRQ